MDYQKLSKKFFYNICKLIERIVYKDIFLRTEEAIRKKKEINICYKGKLEKIKPISFERNKENRNYSVLKVKISNKEYLI